MFYLLFSQTKEEGIRGFWATHLVLKDIFHLGYLKEFDARELQLFFQPGVRASMVPPLCNHSHA